jgi:hypothetical protein
MDCSVDFAVYFGVECAICHKRLPLVEVISAPHVISWEIPHVKPFRAGCDGCKAERQYAYEDIFVFAGPPPGKDFDVHPIFKYINF